jgi:hypothetical protein
VQQTLALPPGTYRLLGRVRLDDLSNDRGLKWSVQCSSRNRLIGETQKFSGRSEWIDFSTTFEVPTEVCPSQVLRLRLDARVPAEQWIGGRAWFDKLRILRESKSHAAEPSRG